MILQNSILVIYYFFVVCSAGIVFSILDVKIRKVRNKYMFIYFILIAILIPFIDFNSFFSSFLLLLLYLVIFFVFYILGILGGADFKYLSINLLSLIILSGISHHLLFYYLFLFAFSLLLIRVKFFLKYGQNAPASLFDHLNVPVAHSFKFLKRLIYVPVVLIDQNHIAIDVKIDNYKVEECESTQKESIDTNALHNFLDIDSSDEIYDEKIKLCKRLFIGKIKSSEKRIITNNMRILFFQPMIPLVPLLFFIHIIASLIEFVN